MISTHAEAKIIKKFDSFGYEIERYIESLERDVRAFNRTIEEAKASLRVAA